MKYEVHQLDRKKLPFIFREDEMSAGEKDFTHWHENIEILYFYRGRGTVTVDFSSTEAEAGDVVIINSEKLHMVESADTEHPVKYYCLILDSEFCLMNGIPVTELTFRQHITGDKALGQIFGDVVEGYRTQTPYRETKIRIAVLNLLYTLACGYLAEGEEVRENDPTHLENVKEAVKFIKENFQQKITIEEVSRAAGLSKAYFSRIFKNVTGYTVVAYMNLVRCRNAAKLLRSGKFKVNEVAVQCGFENMSYFTKTYKQVMGITPSKEA